METVDFEGDVNQNVVTVANIIPPISKPITKYCIHDHHMLVPALSE